MLILVHVFFFQVAPAELENILLKHPDVKEAVVIGIPHDEDQSWPMGVVVPRTGSNATEQDILDFINGIR